MSALVRHAKTPPLLALFLSLALLLGCQPVRLVSPYDQVIDEGVTQFHTDITAFVGKMVLLAGKPEGTYDANKASYPELSAKLSSLTLRATQTPRNDITTQSLSELASNLERLRQLHELGKDAGLTKPLADPALAAISIQCNAILKLEIAKRRGEQD